MRRQRPTAMRGPLRAVLQATPSKSVTHRALVVCAMAEGTSHLLDPLRADDTVATRDALIEMGVEIRVRPDRWSVVGSGGRIPGGGTSFLGESGTSLRLLLALAAHGRQPSRLDGASRLRQRPLSGLIGALRERGARLRIPSEGGLPVQAGGVALRGGSLRVPGAPSSQYASALLLIAPGLPEGLELTLEPPVVSLPYVELTVAVQSAFGGRVERTGPLSWRVEPGGYQGREYRIEGDHSSASFFFAAAALLGGRVRVEGLDPSSAQPDACFGTILSGLGCRVERGVDWIEVHGTRRIPPFDLDLSDTPDLAPTLAALALFAEGPCTLRGIAHLRHKESDRLQVLAGNLRTLGRGASVVEDRLEIGAPGEPLREARIATDSDHRVAMAFAVAALRLEGLELDDAACVAKSNPAFWDQLARLRGE